MKVLRGISFAIALLGVVAAVCFLCFSVAVAYTEFGAGPNATWQEGFGRGLAIGALWIMGIGSSLISGVAAILPAFSYNSFVKTTSRVILVADIIINAVSILIYISLK